MKAEVGFMAGVIAGVLVALYFYHGWFIEECVASNNTRAYCEMKFWGGG